MLSPGVKWRLLSLKTKYGIEILHFEPGKVIIYVATWRRYERRFLSLIYDLQFDPAIESITIDPEATTVEIMYDTEKVIVPSFTKIWLRKLDRYGL